MKINNAYYNLILGAPDFDFKSELVSLDIWEPSELTAIKKLSNDDIASEHYSTFGMTVFPFGHYFTSTERNYAGDNDWEILRLYKEESFDFESHGLGMGPTHLGLQLKFLEYLLDKEMLHEARAFLANHMLNWIHSLAVSLKETNGLIFPKLIVTIEKILINTWNSLSGEDNESMIKFSLQPFDFKKDLLENNKTSLKDIGETLMTPALCGVFISKPTLTNFASKLEIPTGFGSRVMMIETIFKEAVNYEKVETLFSMFEAYFSYWEQSYSDYPIQTIANVWKQRISHSKEMLVDIQKTF